MDRASGARYSAYVEALNNCSLLAQRDFAAAWDRVGKLPPGECREALIVLMQGLVPRYGDMAALVAAQYYEAERLGAGGPADFAAELAEGVPMEQIEASTRYACGHLFEGSGMEQGPELTAAYLAGKVDEYVKQAGRDTIARNAGRDGHARYARIPDGNACDFCRMLGSRGFVYRSKRKASKRESGGKYHPFCNCQVAVSFDPFIEEYYVGWTKVTRGYADDAEVVVPGRDGSRALRDVDIDELYEEYRRAGRNFNKGAKYKSYTRGARLSGEQFADAMRRLEEAETLDELHEAAKAIVDSWPKDAGGMRDRRQWDELSRRARELEKRLRAGSDSVSGVSATVDPEVRAWAKQFPNEELWVQRESGESFYREGTPAEVKTTDAEDASFRNGKAKHTHTTAIGGTFGEDDIWFTTKNWLSEHEVEDVYHGNTYRLVRNANASEDDVERFAMAYEVESFRNYDRLLGEIYDANGGDAGHGHGATLEEKLEAEKRLKPIQHEWLMNNAGTWGYDYYQVV